MTMIIKPPVLLDFPSLFGKLNLTCDVVGSPQPEISWYKDGILLEGERLPYLLLDEVNIEDRGNYYCNASNSVNTADSHEVVVNIKGIVQYTTELSVESVTRRRKRQDPLQDQQDVMNSIINQVRDIKHFLNSDGFE